MENKTFYPNGTSWPKEEHEPAAAADTLDMSATRGLQNSAAQLSERTVSAESPEPRGSARQEMTRSGRAVKKSRSYAGTGFEELINQQLIADMARLSYNSTANLPSRDNATATAARNAMIPHMIAPEPEPGNSGMTSIKSSGAADRMERYTRHQQPPQQLATTRLRDRMRQSRTT